MENIHDKFFKEIFSHADQAKDFIIHTFPKAVVAKLNFSEFKLDTDAYIDDKLSVYFSDIVYNCLYNGKTVIKISLLFEHKSIRQSFPHIQLLQYILGIWETNLKMIVNRQNKFDKALEFMLLLLICLICFLS